MIFFFKEGISKLCVENRKGSALFTVCLLEGNSINSCAVAQESSEQSLLSKTVPGEVQKVFQQTWSSNL